MHACVRACMRAFVGTYGNLWELCAWELMGTSCVGTHGNFVRGSLWELCAWDLRRVASCCVVLHRAASCCVVRRVMLRCCVAFFVL